MKLIFEWDKKKAKAILRRRKISFDEAKTIFNDPLMLTFPDEAHSSDEVRLISLGTSNINRVLLVVHTEYETTENGILIRIISCRTPATPEREFYE